MPGCDRSFATARGRGVHEQRAHKNWYDEKQIEVMNVRSAQWNAEESSLLARQEARLTLEDARFMNQSLAPFFPNRTLQAIKGQRRSQRHKDRVRQYIAEMEGEAEAEADSLQIPIQEQETEHRTLKYDALKSSVIDEIGKQPPLTGPEFRKPMLGRIYENVRTWSKEKIAEEIEIYLLEIFPPPQRRGRGNHMARAQPQLTKRQARRAEYGRTQEAWKKNPCNCLRVLLKDKTASITPEKDVMIPFWREIMTQASDRTPGANPTPVQANDEPLWKAIVESEIRGAFPEMATSPGPDGVTARQLRAMPMNVLVAIMNLFLLCGKLPKHLLESRTTLIPKKDGASEPGDFRPITVSSVITRTFHKILANRLAKFVDIDERQRAFLPVDGTAESIFDLDMILRYHRQNFKPLFLASVDVAKAFDSVTHSAIRDTLKTKKVPEYLVQYITNTYERSTTKLTCGGWESDPIIPRCGVKQGDPLSPIIFNMVMDGLLKQIPPEVGVDVEGEHYNALAFADDLVFTASTPHGLQIVLDIAANYLAKCGLVMNAGKSFTVAIRSVPHVKKSAVDGNTKFSIFGREIPAMRRESEWKYLGVPFTPEGRSKGVENEQLNKAIQTLTKGPLKPQQRLFAMRVMVLPGLYHLLTLGNTTLSRLKKIDSMVRAAVRKWLDLPHDTPNAYIHANVKDGGLSVPSMRWLMPLQRWRRLRANRAGEEQRSPYLAQEIGRAERRLCEGRTRISNTKELDMRWAKLLHEKIDGRALKDSSKVPQQHQWITEGTRFLSGRDFVNAVKLRINAMPTRSRTARGRIKERTCRAGCRAVETLDHVLQKCHRTHKARTDRHNAIASYIKRGLEKSYETVDEEPHFNTDRGLRKPDLVAKKGDKGLVIDAQVVGEHVNLEEAHLAKARKYEHLEGMIKQKYSVRNVAFMTVTLSYRGVWSETSAQTLIKERIIKKKELKILSSRVLIGGLSSFWRFNRATTTANPTRTQRVGVG